MSNVTTDVLIIGGAGSGLSLAIFLNRLGISSWLVERHPTTSPAPKAHYYNQRTMEILREEGIADKLYELGTPAENMARVGWYTSLGGDAELDHKTIYLMDAFGGFSLAATYERDSPCRSANYPQLRLEPLLLAHARTSPLAQLHYHHELVSFTQDADGVSATVLDRDSGLQYEVRTKYLIGADGGRKVGPALGIEMDGIPRLFDMVTVHFAADLSAYLDDDSPMIRWFLSPDKGGSWGSGVMVALGPKHYDRYSEEWLFHFAFQPDDPAQFDAESVVPRLRDLLKLPELEPRIIRMNDWKVQGVLARRYREGRVFLVGDSAHRHPPTTGLGLNSAIQDTHNLAWKLAAVLKGQADPSLLDSYEAERRPVGARNVNWALLTFQNHLVIDAGIGLIPGAPVEVNREAFRLLFSDTPEGATRRQRLHEVIQSQRTEFQAHDIEIGFAYENSAAIIPDGSAAPVKSPMGDEHVPVTRPGHRLPHAWVTRSGGTISTLDLVGRGRFVLLTSSRSLHWQKAAKSVVGAAVDVVAIGPGLDCEDPSGRWAAVRGTEPDGAILVRPDGHVAWRAEDSDRSGQLAAVIARILGRENAA